jgi:hypothetical protein
MKFWGKIVLGVGAATGITYLVRLARASAQIETVSTAQIFKLDLTGLTIRVDVAVKNPTKSSLGIKFPFVKLMYKDAMIGSSQVLNKDIKLPSYGEARIEAIMIQIPVIGLFSIGTELLKAVQNGTGVKVQVKTISTIDLGLKTVPYEKTEDITLKKDGNV